MGDTMKADALRCYCCGDPIDDDHIRFSDQFPEMEVCGKYPDCSFVPPKTESWQSVLVKNAKRCPGAPVMTPNTANRKDR